jgi:hypothetical protein
MKGMLRTLALTSITALLGCIASATPTLAAFCGEPNSPRGYLKYATGLQGLKGDCAGSMQEGEMCSFACKRGYYIDGKYLYCM